MRTAAYSLYWLFLLPYRKQSRWLTQLQRRLRRLLLVFHRRPPQRSIWKNIRLPGKVGNRTLFSGCGGLSANVNATEAANTKELHKRFDEQYEFRLSNLPGGDGTFIRLARSGVWHWCGKRILKLQRALRNDEFDNVILYGHSTGALVMVIVAWIVQALDPDDRRDRQRIVALLLVAPAFYLKRRLASYLLHFVVFQCWFLMPLGYLLLAVRHPWLTPLLVVAFGVAWQIPLNLSLPNNETASEEERTAVARLWVQVLLPQVLLTCLPPLLLVMLGPFLTPAQEFLGMLAYVAALVTQYTMAPYGFAVKALDRCEERRESSHYEILPLLTLTHLLFCEWLASIALRHIRLPILVVFCGNDDVVDNERGEAFVCRVVPDSELVEIERLPDASHSQFSEEQNCAYCDIFEAWARKQLAKVA